MFKFLSTTDFNMHTLDCHEDKRSNKRTRLETSLIFDPTICTICEQLKFDIIKAKEDLNLCQFAYNETKESFSSSVKEVTELNRKIESLETELADVKRSITEVGTGTSQEELEIVKDMVIEKDKLIKKLEESHKKATDKFTIDKKASDEALNIATVENTKLKDKDSTLMDIFKCMKEYMNEKLGSIKEVATADHTEEQTLTQFKCDQCTFKAANIDNLNIHKRNEHIRATFPCTICNYIASTINDFKAHQSEHIFKCNLCDYRDKTKENLSNHSLAKHLEHKCNKCSFTSTSTDILASHKVKNHTDKKQMFKCEECEFEDTREEITLNHTIAQHSTIICDLCDFNTTTLNKLADHEVNIHKKTKHICNQCS